MMMVSFVFLYFQILDKATGHILVNGGADPDEAVVAQDDARPARKVVKVSLLPPDQGRAHFEQTSLGQLLMEREVMIVAR